jgi:hypothetical protein
MYLSLAQIITSVERLQGVHPFFGFAFLGFKKAELPVGKKADFSYAAIKDLVLEPYFKVAPESHSYFNPFKTTSRWVSPRYDSTSLQRVIADTFGSAFLHTKKTSEWGWVENYVEVLKSLLNKTQSDKIPLLDLAVWLYRDNDIIDPDPKLWLYQHFVAEFSIHADELAAVFETDIQSRSIELSPELSSYTSILNHIGWPEDSAKSGGVVVKSLQLKNVGPASALIYEPLQRLNLIVGDNSLGKTFLMDCLWWSFTGNWIGYPAEPSSQPKGSPEIGFTFSDDEGRVQHSVSPYNRVEARWQRSHIPKEGLALYSTHRGDIAVWDPIAEIAPQHRWHSHLTFSRKDVWDGLNNNEGGRSTAISNGLIRDWITWQAFHNKYALILEAFEESLEELSPPDGPRLRSGEPTTLADDARQMPTIRMPYGDVPVVNASAGIQRIIALAYMLVWHWFQHTSRCKILGRNPHNKMLILLDEIEAHLHPRWQRQILPALLKTIRALSPDLQVQFHVATHSPLVLASMEPEFQHHLDRLHHLRLEKDDVVIEESPLTKQGSVDAWLQSEFFGLADARSQPAERAIARAKELQAQAAPDPASIRRAHTDLVKLLPDDDPFWPRWTYFHNAASNIENKS